ncbi:MAG: hypothetical protein IPK14_25440 [Blastocatellia bacterium]|nr:hypothetical protein [Blastocatellia bacterium]MBL8193784.1 hypothetical protein [Blastocatellia bacterium]MBN8725310.1 hypothetical protein [Acidobacteriota bacterium]
MEIKTADYYVRYDENLATIFFGGFLRLEGVDAYKEILDLCVNVFDKQKQISMNLTDLQFLNSSGISMFSMFVLKIRDLGDAKLTIQGSEKILWQTKSLKNLKRLMPSMTLEFI